MRFGARLDLLLAGADLDAPRGEHLKLFVDADRRRHARVPHHADRAVDLARVDGPPGFKPSVKLLQDRRRRSACPRRADQCKVISPPEDMDAQLMFDLREIAVKFAAEVDQQTVVGKFQKGFVVVFRVRRRGQGTYAQ